MSLVKIRRVSSASLLPLSVSFPFSAVRLPDAIVVVIKQEFDLSFVAQTLVMDGLSIRRGQLCLTTLRITLLNMPLLSAFALPELGLDQLRIVLVISVEAKRTRRVALDVNHTFLAAAAGSGASFSRSNFYIFYPQAAISTRFLGVILPIVPQIISARDLTRTRHSSWPS